MDTESDKFPRAVEECRPHLLELAKAELPVLMRPKVGVSDIVQETIIRGIELSSTFSGTTQQELFWWLRAILEKQLLNFRRRYFRKKRNPALEVLANSGHVNPKQQEPVQDIVSSEQRELLENAISQLPEDYRNSILLRHWEKLTFAEIGVVTQKTEEAARKTWKRAVGQLKKILIKESFRHESDEA
jgi:RNA polymerase sigma-70 factor (ECF subfamily)